MAPASAAAATGAGERRHAVVIGAGVGGLSAAIELAAAGVSVDVLEAHPAAGGKVGIAASDGLEFDTGPSVLTLPETLGRLFRLAGGRLEDEVQLIEPVPSFRYLYPDGVALDVHPRLEATLASVRATLGARAEGELGKFLGYAERIWGAAAPHFVFGPAPRLLRLAAAPRALASLLRIDPLHTMRAAIWSRVRSPHLRMLLARYATYNGSDVRRAPATLNCISHVELGLGGFGVHGGMYEIVRALVRAAQRLGVRLHTGERATRICFARGRVSGVETATGFWPASLVVGNADAAHVLGELLPQALRSAEKRTTLSMSAWTGVFRARRRAGTERRIAHTVLFPKDYLAEFADIFDLNRPPLEPTVYLCAQEAAHGRAGWPDDEPVFLMANAPPLPPCADSVEPVPAAAEAAAADAAALFRVRVLERARAAGLLDAADRLVWERGPAQLARDFPGSRGSIYGSASNDRFSAFRRPPNRISQPAGLYLASGSAHPGGGVPLCILSGRAAARAALEDLGMGAAE